MPESFDEKRLETTEREFALQRAEQLRREFNMKDNSQEKKVMINYQGKDIVCSHIGDISSAMRQISKAVVAENPPFWIGFMNAVGKAVRSITGK